MTSRRTGVYPQRHDVKRGWWVCQPHRATHWAAYLEGKLVGRYTEKRHADHNMTQASVRRKGPARRYGFGRRMETPQWRTS